MAENQRSLGPFRPESGKWSMRLDQYCLLNGVEDSPRKKALLMTVGGEDVFDVIVNLFSPNDPTAESVSYDQVCEKLNTFYKL